MFMLSSGSAHAGLLMLHINPAIRVFIIISNESDSDILLKMEISLENSTSN